MIIFGILARNVIPDAVMGYYNDVWAGYMRMIFLGIILLRGGMEISFKGTGLMVFVLSFIP